MEQQYDAHNHPKYDVHAPHKAHHVHHPATKLWVATILLLGLVVVFGFITVFIPWAVKDIAVAQRAWAFPFKTCIENTFSPVNEETCSDNDFIQPEGVPLTGENAKCKGFILATIAFVFISVLLGLITMIIIGYILEHLWWSPYKVAIAADILLFIVCVACFLTWIMFICYMETVCAENSIFPISPGYSYGFIMYLFATVFSIASLVTGIWGTVRIAKYKRIENEEKMAYMDPYAMPPPFFGLERPGSGGVPMMPAPSPPFTSMAPLSWPPVDPYAIIAANNGVPLM